MIKFRGCTDFKASAKPSLPSYDTTLHIQLNLFILHLEMAFRGFIIIENHHGSDEFYALRSRVHEDQRVPLVRRRVGRIGDGEDDVDFVTGIARACDPLRGGESQ